MAKKGQKFKIFDEEIIQKVVNEKIKNGKSYSYLSRKYKVSKGSIATWVRKYKYKGYITREKRGVKKNPSNMTIEELRIENEILKKFQAFLKQQHEKR
jgi:transposase